MPALLNPDQLYFPPVDEADDDGLLAIGGNLSEERLLLAYRMGIFPWYTEEEPICWWSPNPRCILFPNDLNTSKSMCSVLNKGEFRFTINKNFISVINNCKKVVRRGQPGTWITEEIISVYSKLHKSGHVHSAETWLDGQLVGGLYGIRMGKVFFGESMFSTVSNASKFAFIRYVAELKKEGIELIDCQVDSPHLRSLGATLISRQHFIQMLNDLT